MSQYCVYCPQPQSSRSRGKNNTVVSSLHSIERYAFNHKCVVGSFYDAKTDNVLRTLSIANRLISSKPMNENPTCSLRKINNLNYENLLKLMEIESESRLSIVLGLTKIDQGTLMFSNYPIKDNHNVRFIDYCHFIQEETLSNDIQQIQNTLHDQLPHDDATHIITNVKKGIDFIIALTYNEIENENEIDSILEKLCNCFIKPNDDFISMEEQQKIKHFKPTIFTNVKKILSIEKNQDFIQSCQDIRQYLQQNRDNVPLICQLNRIKCIYTHNSIIEKTFCQLDEYIVDKIEQKILPLNSQLKRLEYSFHQEVFPKLKNYIKHPLDKVQTKMKELKDMYEKFQQSLANKVIDCRQGQVDVPSIEKLLNDTQLKSLETELENLSKYINTLRTKILFIDQLNEKYPIEYINVADFAETNDDETTLKTKLVSLKQNKKLCYLLSSDELIGKNADQHDKLCQRMNQLLKTNSSIHLVFADFSYCSFELKSMEILFAPLEKRKEINVLLVGETGVGKSTFINAFVNYLAFDSLKEATTGEPIVLIPASFLITIGYHFQEKEIHYGQPNSNENQNNQGQSVTQHCQSYLFYIGNNRILRIIDTPGIGDTRGVKQDHENIQHILFYINNLSHLNAICFLLKPNITRLNGYFRSCFTQLYEFLGPDVRRNIIFCFTNTRSTFYAPGETGPWLTKMLKQSYGDSEHPLSKEKTFCFDSESFRYLAIIKSTQEMPFDETQKIEYDDSWKWSVSESIRLLKVIENCPDYPTNKCRSIQHAQMMITLLVRPILETIRCVLRNLVLHDLKNDSGPIKMQAESISIPACFCTGSAQNMVQINDIWIMEDSSCEYHRSNKCVVCKRTFNRDFSTFYKLKHQLDSSKRRLSYSEIENMKSRLLHASYLFTRFLYDTNKSSENPFLPWLNRFIEQEALIYSKKPSNVFAGKLCESIDGIQNTLINHLKDCKSEKDPVSLESIYGIMNELLLYPMISEQRKAIENCQLNIMKREEYDVSSQYPQITMNESLLNSITTN